jgi:hypothetical protein
MFEYGTAGSTLSRQAGNLRESHGTEFALEAPLEDELSRDGRSYGVVK